MISGRFVFLLMTSVAVSLAYRIKYPLQPAEPLDFDQCTDISGTYIQAAVASDAHTDCSQIGVDILRQNGSAVDAAIATTVCLGLVSVQSCGIGGGHIMTVYIKKENKFVSIFGREVAPAFAERDTYLNRGPILKGLSIGVPSEVMGLWQAHQLYGRLEWKKLFEPSIRLSREGYRVSPETSRIIRDFMEDMVNSTELLNFLWNTKTKDWYKTGEIIKNPRLADTLEKIAEEGADAFYNGSLTEDIVADIRDTGGKITAQDLKNYRARVQDVISFKLTTGHTVHTTPLPSGGPVLLYILNILDGYNYTQNKISGEDQTVTAYHRIIEAFKYGFAARTRMGDPEFVPHMAELVRNVTDPATGAAIRRLINDSCTYGISHYNPAAPIVFDAGTSHLSVLAPNGDAVSLTSSVNSYFGSKIFGRRTGILFNDQMRNFAINEEFDENAVPPNEANVIVTNKMPMSSMSPSIITNSNGDVTHIIGGSGAPRIMTSIVTVLSQLWWFNQSLAESIRYPRIHDALYSPVTEIETGFPQNIKTKLELLGHTFNTSINILPGRVQCIMVSDKIYAGADYRKCGSVDGW